ncbi:DUF5753 domain-containing protein [Streptomyces sp. NPDC048462]|uniref:DUF5753 domain-containing protein n=1 Tax=Streptomyces sp. NPDC048462 TaxID=3365555 RepID=UPI00370FA790
MKPNRKEAADIVRGTRDSSKAGWWRAAPAESLSEHIDRLGRLESAADTIQSYQPLMIPGMLQTFQYAASAIKATTPALPPEEVADRADRRLKRIDSLGFSSDRRAWFVLSEETLRRPVGGKAVLIEQLEHLLNVAALRPSVTLQVMPEASEGHPGLSGGFTMYRIGGQRAVFTETLTGTLISTRPEDIAAFSSAYDHVTAEALPPAASLELIDTARRTLCQQLEMSIWSG